MSRSSLCDGGQFLETLIFWRFWLLFAAGIGSGLAIYHLGGRDPAWAAVALVAWISGVVAGLLWQFAAKRSD